MKTKEYITPAIKMVSLDPEESLMLNATSGGDVDNEEKDVMGDSNRRNSIWGNTEW